MKISNQEILLMNALQIFSGVNAKDCLINGNNVVFLVNEKDVGAVIGKEGSTIKNFRKKIRKNVEVFGFTIDPINFLKNAFREIKFNGIELKEIEEKKVVNINVDSENKRKMLNETGKIKKIRELMERNYNIEKLNIR